MNNNVDNQADYKMGNALHQHDINDINIAYYTTQMGEIGVICGPQDDGNALFEVTSTTLHLL